MPIDGMTTEHQLLDDTRIAYTRQLDSQWKVLEKICDDGWHAVHLRVDRFAEARQWVYDNFDDKVEIVCYKNDTAIFETEEAAILFKLKFG